MLWCTEVFYPFLTYIALISVFCLTYITTILTQFLSFYLNRDKYSCWSVWERHCERDSKCGGVPERIGALKIFGRIWVQTLAACMAGECFLSYVWFIGLPYFLTFLAGAGYVTPQDCWNYCTIYCWHTFINRCETLCRQLFVVKLQGCLSYLCPSQTSQQ